MGTFLAGGNRPLPLATSLDFHVYTQISGTPTLSHIHILGAGTGIPIRCACQDGSFLVPTPWKPAHRPHQILADDYSERMQV
jgi:hypothetical protein